jgi:hypothetical protein
MVTIAGSEQLPGAGVTQPLNPFPTTWVGNGAVSNAIPGGFSINFSAILTVIFFIVFFIWFIYTMVACYHWFRCGHQSWFAVPAIALHLFISGFCILFAISGLL